MKIYILSICGYEDYYPIILYHENDKLDFEELSQKVFIDLFNKLIDEKKEEVLLNEYKLVDLAANELVNKYSFIRPEKSEFMIKEFSIFGPLYSDRMDGWLVERLPQWIPEEVQKKMLSATEKFLKKE